MGGSKGGGSTTQTGSSSTTSTPTAEETELNKLQLEREKFLDPQIRQTQSQGLSLINQLLLGGSLPGFLSNLPGGISPEVTQGIVDQSLRDVNSQLSKSGVGSFLDSGVAQSIGARTSGDIRRASEEFNIGNRLNLLNLALSGQAQVQQPIIGFSNLLSQRLAGLRPSTTNYSLSQTTPQTKGRSFFSFF